MIFFAWNKISGYGLYVTPWVFIYKSLRHEEEHRRREEEMIRHREQEELRRQQEGFKPNYMENVSKVLD